MMDDTLGVHGTPNEGDQIVIHLEDHHRPYEVAILATITGIENDTLHVTIDANGYDGYNGLDTVDTGSDWTVTPGRGTERFTQTVYTLARFHTTHTTAHANPA